MGVQRDADVGVPQPLRNDLRVHTCGEGERGPAVAQVVQPDPREPELPRALEELPREPLRVQRLTVNPAEDEVVIGPAAPHL
jgi:hypothetical protein